MPGGPTNFAAVQAAVAADASMSRSVAAAMLSGFKASLAALSAPEDAQPSSSHGAAAGTGSEEDARDPGLAVALLQCGLELLQVPCLREAVRQLLDQPARHAVLQAAVERLVSVSGHGVGSAVPWSVALLEKQPTSYF